MQAGPPACPMPSITVIGAGIVGSTIAWELASAGASVRLIDARTPGDGATRASAGVLAPYIEGGPRSALRELGRESLDLYDAFITRLRAESHREVFYHRNGTLEVALTQAEAEHLSATSGTLWSDGVEARWVPASVIPDLEPGVSPDAQGALFIPSHGYVGVSSLTAAAVVAAEQRGTEVLEETGAIQVSPVAGGGVSVRTASSAWESDIAVLAAGSWSSRITIDGAEPVPVKPIRGQLLQLLGPRGLLNRVIWGTAGYLVPWPDGTVLVGATVEDVGFDESVHAGRPARADGHGGGAGAGAEGSGDCRHARRPPAARSRRPAAHRSLEGSAGADLRHRSLSQRRAADPAHRADRAAPGVRARLCAHRRAGSRAVWQALGRTLGLRS